MSAELRREREDALESSLENLVREGKGLRQAFAVSGFGLARLRGWLNTRGRSDLFESLEMNSIGDRP